MARHLMRTNKKVTSVDMSGVVTCSLSINPPPSDCPYWEDDRVFVSEHTAMAEAFNVLVY